MRLKAILSLLILMKLFTHLGRTSAQPGWAVIAPGIEFRQFYLQDPNIVHVARMDRSYVNLGLESSIALGKLSGGTETVSSMAARYDQAINYWGETWGNRNKVVVAINGYFYDTETGVPWRGQVHSGWYAKRFDDRQNGSGLVWKMDRSLFIGGCVIHRPEVQTITFLTTGESLSFNAINAPRGENQLVLYTPQYDNSTYADESGVEVVVEMRRPTMIIPSPSMSVGVIRQVRAHLPGADIPFDNVVLSGHGTAEAALLRLAKEGEEIGISQDIRHFDAYCSASSPNNWEKAYASIGGSFAFLQAGAIQSFSDLGAIIRNPRTAIAYNDRYIFFIVVDGRNPYHSLGMSIVELGHFVKYTLGASWAVAQDGGGSSTMVVNLKLKNYPNADLAGTTEAKLERGVANGMMMVEVLPRETSSTFASGENVLIIPPAEIRLGPGDNFGLKAILDTSIPGVILPESHQLNGILAKGDHWWKVQAGEFTGWLRETSLSPTAAP